MAETVSPRRELPADGAKRRASGWWGVWTLIATEAALFAYLLFGYAYLAAQSHGAWPAELPRLRLSLPNTVILIASSFVFWWAEAGIRRGERGRLMIGLGITFIMGAVFVGVQWTEWRNKKFALSDSAYASSFFTTTGFHMAHVVGGLLVIAVLLLWAALGKFGQGRHTAVSIGAAYWHFVDVVWIAVFTTFYVLPYLAVRS